MCVVGEFEDVGIEGGFGIRDGASEEKGMEDIAVVLLPWIASSMWMMAICMQGI